MLFPHMFFQSVHGNEGRVAILAPIGTFSRVLAKVSD